MFLHVLESVVIGRLCGTGHGAVRRTSDTIKYARKTATTGRGIQPLPLLREGSRQHEVVGEPADALQLGDGELALLGRVRHRRDSRVPVRGADRGTRFVDGERLPIVIERGTRAALQPHILIGQREVKGAVCAQVQSKEMTGGEFYSRRTR